LSELEESTNLEIVDTDSEKVVRKFRQTAKAIQVRVEKKRLQINRAYKDETDLKAKELQNRLIPIYANLDEKIKMVEADRLERKEEKARIEKERKSAIDDHLDTLNLLCIAGLKYNIPSEDIEAALDMLKTQSVTEEIFQETFEDALKMQQVGILNTQNALGQRLQFEAMQAEQEAERKRLANEKKVFEEEAAKEARRHKGGV